LWAELFDFKEVLREDVILLEMFDWDPGGDESGDKDDFIGCFKVCKHSIQALFRLYSGSIQALFMKSTSSAASRCANKTYAVLRYMCPHATLWLALSCCSTA
jgi:hypothetical protein